MKIKMKKILAFLCAVVLVVTTVLGNWYTKQVQAEEATEQSTEQATEPQPVQLPGFRNITIKDFVDSSGNRMEAKEYTTGADSFYAPRITNFDKTLLSMKVRFKSVNEGSSPSNSIWIGGTGRNSFNLRVEESGGSYLIAAFDATGNVIGSSATRPVIYANQADVGSFLNTEFLLQLSFQYGTPDENNKADLMLGIYINGVLYNDAAFTITDCDMTKVGRYMYMERGTDESITVDNVIIPAEPIYLDGYENITISDFVDSSGNTMEAKEYTEGSDSYFVKDLANFDKTLLSLRVNYNGGGYSNNIYVCGTGRNTGFNMRVSDDGSFFIIAFDVLSDLGSAERPVIYASNTDVNNFLNEEFLLQLSFDYGEPDANGKATLTLGVYINGVLYNNAAFVINNCDMATTGSYMSLTNGSNQSITIQSVEIPKFAGYTEVSVEDFVDASDNVMGSKAYMYDTAPETLNTFHLKDHISFNNIVLSMKVKFKAGSYSTRIDVAGTGNYKGLSIYPGTDGNALAVRDLYSMTSGASLPTLTADKAKVTSFVDNEFLLQLTFQYGDYDNDSTADDLRLGIYINGKLYDNEKFIITNCDMTKFGNYIGLYRANEDSYIIVGSANEETFPANPLRQPSERYEKITFGQFGILDGTYQSINGTYNGAESFDKKVVCGDVKFDGSGWCQFMLLHDITNRCGLRLVTNSSSTMYLRWYYTLGDYVEIATFQSDTAGVLFVGESYNLKISTEVVDVTSDKIDDIKIGVWFNNVLYADTYYTLSGATIQAKMSNMLAADVLGNILEIACSTTGTTVTVGSEKELLTQPDATLEKITFSEFGVEDGVYGYNVGDIGADGDYLYGTSVDKTVLCGNVRLSGTSELTLMLGGFEEDPSRAWSGMRLVKYANSDVLRLLGPAEKNYQQYGAFEPAKAGADFLNEEFELMWSVELIANDADGETNDIKVGIWFDGFLYNNEYIIIPDCNSGIGSLFATYVGAEGDSITLNSAEEYSKWPNKNFDKITFSDFGLETGKYDLTSDVVAKGTVSEYPKFDGVVFSGDVRLSDADAYQIIYGGDSGWNGLRLMTNNACTAIHVYWYKSSNESQYLATIVPSDVGLTSFAQQTFNLMISTELVDADNGGEKNDIKVGIWINKIRCEFGGKAYHVATDWGEYLQNGFSVAGTAGKHVLLRNVGDYQKNPYYYEDISDYRGATKDYPEEEGYVFAGWYEDAEYKTAIEPDVTSGKAWAKFVEEDVLSVKSQIKFTVDTNGDNKADALGTSTDLRFVTTVDNLEYRRMSFYIEKDGGRGEIDAAKYDEYPRLVYEQLYAIGDKSETIEYVPTVFSWQSKYFKAFTLEGIPENDYDNMVKVTPYWITMDGTIVRGKALETCVAEYDKNVSQAVSVDYIGKDTMPITGFNGPYPVTDANDAMLFPDYVTDEYFKMIADSGVNVVISAYMDFKTHPTLVKKALTLGEKYGISIFVQDSTILEMTTKEAVEKQIANYNTYKSFAGMYLVDEPGTESYKQDKGKLVSTYQTIAGILNELNILTHVNLYPIVDTTDKTIWESIVGDGGIKQEDKNNYSAYVSEVNSKLDPAVLMWDYYPFVEDDSKMDLGLYFWNMAEIRKQAQADNKPFWAYVQAGGNWNDDYGYINTTNYYPSEGEFNWNMNTALAFGAQGIQYFPLIQPKHFAYAGSSAEDKMWDFNRNGLIGAFGNKTEWYDYAQKANAHVGAIDSVLMNSYSKQIIAVGDGATNATSELNGVVTSASYNELISASGNALIGCFDYKGKTALYVVNYDYTNGGNVTLNFNEEKNITKVENAKKTTTSVSSMTLEMTAGEGILLVIE